MTTASQPDTHVFPLLAEPATYRACHWDLIQDAEKRAYWIRHYRGHFPGLLAEAVEVEVSLGHSPAEAAARGHACRAEFERYLHDLETNPPTTGRLDILTMGLQRERILRAHGFADPYLLVKRRENEAAMKLLPKLLADLDAMPVETRMLALIEGCFAGNIFDVGANATLALFKSGQMDFHATRATLKRRPWCIDDLDAWMQRMGVRAAAPGRSPGLTARGGVMATRRPHRAAVLFVDNAGCDVVLGMIPLARELLRRGTQVILAANTTPSLNDITAKELRELVTRIAGWDATIGEAWRGGVCDDASGGAGCEDASVGTKRDAARGGTLEVVATGCGTPLIDLSLCSRELVEAVNRRGVDLVILEGMGRAVESNLHVPFKCDVMKIALLKDPSVAKSLGGEMYDPVLRFEPPR